MISAWAKRRTVENLDSIEDVGSVTPRKERQKLAFEVNDGMSREVSTLTVDFERVPPVAQLAVHKKKVAEVSNWLKEFPHHRKVAYLFIKFTLEIVGSFRTCGGWKVYDCAEFSSTFRF